MAMIWSSSASSRKTQSDNDVSDSSLMLLSLTRHQRSIIGLITVKQTNRATDKVARHSTVTTSTGHIPSGAAHIVQRQSVAEVQGRAKAAGCGTSRPNRPAARPPARLSLIVQPSPLFTR